MPGPLSGRGPVQDIDAYSGMGYALSQQIIPSGVDMLAPEAGGPFTANAVGSAVVYDDMSGKPAMGGGVVGAGCADVAGG